MANKTHENDNATSGVKGKRTSPASPSLNMKTKNWPGLPGKSDHTRGPSAKVVKQYAQSKGVKG